MLDYFAASQSEVIRAIASGYSPCCGVPHQEDLLVLADRPRRVVDAELHRLPAVHLQGAQSEVVRAI